MATIRITPKFPPVMFALRLSPVKLLLDGGQEQELPWSKTTELAVDPGSHHVHLYVPWLVPSKMGPADADLTLADGEVVELRYKPPWLRWRPGRLRIR